jgi:hypothetical protein
MPTQTKTFYTLHVHRKDGSLRHHVMQGEVPKVGATVLATLANDKVSAKVGAVTDPLRSGDVMVEVQAEEEV